MPRRRSPEAPPRHVTVAELCRSIHRLAPEALAEDWDNGGLLVGRAGAPVDRLLVALDLRPVVVGEARERGCQAVLTHHPAIFPTIAAITDGGGAGTVLDAAEAGSAVLAAHTNLDSARGGLNDIMAAALGIDDPVPLAPSAADESAGLGRVGEVAPTTLGALAELARQAFGAHLVRITGEVGVPVGRVACCTGSGGGLVELARRSAADAYVTGDLRYHDADRADGMPLIDLPHGSVEGHAMGVWSEGLAAALSGAGVEVLYAAKSTDPWRALAPD